ncbi:peptide chain release factor N(5)-glutamine methyltransferase [Paenibacillus radicis (ex Xue et al. 2023)]|uniref:Release factor glutamine methyltransferase n=1 Tax=Paenibacillus radicis (ex Xue et al. 2023) TaxID=2972489 RepID=A0ABT1YGH9_9BACL|nr:peptide chain release factor N(5)-glutamine methyltransferase [Paenibacillus radicis (ex Xue et al. 2023)]MCR8632304.1 peptide chain release factor N(5)-glutamine methyltransferase [Paenibacillus radicis (ex Xue et al. 2023)]
MTAEQQLTIREAYVEASSFLQGHQVQEAANCADLLLQHVLGFTRSELLLRWQEMFPVEQLELWQQLLKRKAAGEPVQYIIGEQEFYGLPFTVNPAVLIPRPETELLVEQVVLLGKRLWPELAESGADQEREAGAGPLIADIGAGSGAIAVSLAVQCPQWRIMSSDISPAALAVAGANAERHGVSERVDFTEGDLLVPYIERGLRLDAVVSNPPYIPEADEEGLQPEVRLYEPRTALYGGADGLVLYRRLAAQLKELPAMPALVGLEVGLGQAQAVAKLLSDAAEWDQIRIIPDLAGIERHVIAVRYTR